MIPQKDVHVVKTNNGCSTLVVIYTLELRYFHASMLSNRKLLGKISSTAKYGWADKEDEEENKDEEDKFEYCLFLLC